MCHYHIAGSQDRRLGLNLHQNHALGLHYCVAWKKITQIQNMIIIRPVWYAMS